jgi:hypothetical protein
VVPTLDGLLIESVDLGNNEGLLIISIPAQAEELRPFLVHGAVVEGKALNSFFSIARRRGEGSMNITASQIHAYIVAGRAYLRGAAASPSANPFDRDV